MANNYYSDYEKTINDQYNNAIGGLDKTQAADKLKAQQQYGQYRNQASVGAAKNQMALREAMASQGLFKSGDNITGQLSINNQRNGDISKANMEEGNYMATLDQEKYKRQQEYEMSRQNALREAMVRSQEWQYRDDRDKVTDDRYKTEWDYNLGRDKITDDRYNKEWDYNLGRDNITDDRYKNEWDYKKEQDLLSQSNWERQFAKTGSSGGGGGSSSSSSGSSKTTTDNVWDAYSQQFTGQSTGHSIANAASWLNSNKNDIVEATSQAEYKRMQDELLKQQQKRLDDEKRKKQIKVY